MLKIRQVKHLASSLSTTPDELATVLDSLGGFYEELLLTDPARPDKPRVVVSAHGALRALQARLYRRILLPKLSPSAHSHGGVPGRSIKSNVEPHLGSKFAFKTDIFNFFPSIHFRRVYKLFAEQLECSPDVARVCTKICTYRHRLELGLVCSPILADQLLRRVDRRIFGACDKLGVAYTRYVDDLALSGPFDFRKSGLPALIEEILAKDGFKVNREKHVFGSLSDGLAITSLRDLRGHLDVRREYLDEVERQIDDAGKLARNANDFVGPYFTREQVLGRVRFVAWVNPGRRRSLLGRFRSVNWKAARQVARDRKYEVTKKKLSKLPPPDNPRTSTPS